MISESMNVSVATDCLAATGGIQNATHFESVIPIQDHPVSVDPPFPMDMVQDLPIHSGFDYLRLMMQTRCNGLDSVASQERMDSMRRSIGEYVYLIPRQVSPSEGRCDSRKGLNMETISDLLDDEPATTMDIALRVTSKQFAEACGITEKDAIDVILQYDEHGNGTLEPQDFDKLKARVTAQKETRDMDTEYNGNNAPEQYVDAIPHSITEIPISTQSMIPSANRQDNVLTDTVSKKAIHALPSPIHSVENRDLKMCSKHGDLDVLSRIKPEQQEMMPDSISAESVMALCGNHEAATYVILSIFFRFRCLSFPICFKRPAVG